MAGPDFRALLSKPAESVKRPVPVPAGTYYGTIKQRQFDESKERKTPFCRYTVGNIRAGEDIDPAMLEGQDLSKKTFQVDYYITPDAEYRLVEALESMGIRKEGRSIGEMIEDSINQEVQLAISIRPADARTLASDPEHPGYNNVDKMSGIASS